MINEKKKNSHRSWKTFPKLMNVGLLIRLQGLEKNPKLINVVPTSIPESRVSQNEQCHECFDTFFL